MADPDPLLDPPSWLPEWFSIDNVRTARRASVIVGVALFAAMAACVVESAGNPADPQLVPDVTIAVPELDTSTSVDPAEPCPVAATGADGSTLALVESLGTAEVVVEFADGFTRTFCVVVADSPEERNQGLMGITDFTTVEGMVFVYDAPSSGPFYMFGTPTPLVISWWDDAGSFISRADMEPCLVDDPAECDRFPPAAPFVVALELPQSIGETIVFSADDSLRLVPLS